MLEEKTSFDDRSPPRSKRLGQLLFAIRWLGAIALIVIGINEFFQHLYAAIQYSQGKSTFPIKAPFIFSGIAGSPFWILIGLSFVLSWMKRICFLSIIAIVLISWSPFIAFICQDLNGLGIWIACTACFLLVILFDDKLS